MEPHGQIQLYLGNGKGKTTAAVGLALRSLGHGKKVVFAQFLKNQPTGEMIAFQHFKAHITFKQFGTGEFILKTPTQHDIEWAQKGLLFILDAIKNVSIDVVILDEILDALELSLLSLKEVQSIFLAKHAHVELVLTGRNAPQEILEQANLITTMSLVKHYFDSGIPARAGIEF